MIHSACQFLTDGCLLLPLSTSGETLVRPASERLPKDSVQSSCSVPAVQTFRLQKTTIYIYIFNVPMKKAGVQGPKDL